MKHQITTFLFLTLTASVAYATPPINTPWPCDKSYTITQGHNGGSHTAKGAWAWDIGIPVNGEVSSPADGVVRMVRMDSTRGACDSAYANDANYIIVDFQDGTEALFLHLQAGSTGLKVGDVVTAGQVVGRVGLTGWVCGAHLHFQIQETCNSWWCQSIPAQFTGIGDPTSGTYKSNNCAPPPACGAVASAEEALVIDEQDPGCFERFTTFWWSEGTGDNGHHYYTYAIEAAEADTHGKWKFDVAEAGLYKVEAFISAGAGTKNARYQVDGGAGVMMAEAVNQAGNQGWVELGVFELEAGEDRWVGLGDNTGEAADDRLRVVFDAIRVSAAVPEVPLDPIDPEDPTNPNADPDSSPIVDGEGDADMPGENGDETGAESDGFVEVSEGCSTTGGPGASGWLLVLGALVGFARRRRPHLE